MELGPNNALVYTSLNSLSSLFEYLKQKFDHVTNAKIKSFTNTMKKITTAQAHRRFLLSCRNNDVLPKHLMNIHENLKHMHFYSNYGKKIFNKTTETFQNKLLNLEIVDINIHINYLQKFLTSIENVLNSQIDVDLFSHIKKTYNTHLKNYNEKLKQRHHKKLESIIISNQLPNNIIDPYNSLSNAIDDNNNNNTWFINLTNTDIPKNVVDTVSLGQKFSTRTSLNNKNAIETIKNIENLLGTYDFPKETKDDIRHNTIANINHYLNNNNKHINAIDRIFLKNSKETKSFLNEHNDIFFTNSDKGNMTVALQNFDYFKEMDDLLNDTSTYTKLDHNPLKDLRTATKDFLTIWNVNGFLQKEYHKYSLTQTDTVLPKLYGLPKVHKIYTDEAGIRRYKLRPVLSTVNTPTKKFAKYFSSLITNSTNRPNSYIKNSKHFIEKISHTHIPDNHILISLDASSLFTNVPLDLVKNSIEKRYSTIIKHTNIPLNELHNAIDFFHNHTYLQFNGQYYQQIYGSPMGSAVSSIFADLVLADLEEHCLSQLDFKPIFFVRYVDDILTCIPTDKTEHILNTFNSYHSRLQFTHELETDNSINFLDVKLIRHNNKLSYNWYRKPSSSGRYLNFNSGHTKHQKIGMIYTLVDKAILLSEECYHTENLDIVKQLLINNNYPTKFIEYYMKKRVNTLEYRTTNAIDNGSHLDINKKILIKKPKVSIPHVDGFYNSMCGMLKKHGIVPIPNIINNNSNLVIKAKDRTPKGEKTNVIYKIECEQCDASYVGQTKREASVRIGEHKAGIDRIIKKEKKLAEEKDKIQPPKSTRILRSTKKDKNTPTIEVPNDNDNINNIKKKKKEKEKVVTQHYIDTKHNFKWNDFSILDREPSYHKRNTSEVLHINTQLNPINLKEDSQGLFKPYLSVIHKMKKYMHTLFT